MRRSEWDGCIVFLPASFGTDVPTPKYWLAAHHCVHAVVLPPLERCRRGATIDASPGPRAMRARSAPSQSSRQQIAPRWMRTESVSVHTVACSPPTRTWRAGNSEPSDRCRQRYARHRRGVVVCGRRPRDPSGALTGSNAWDANGSPPRLHYSVPVDAISPASKLPVESYGTTMRGNFSNCVDCVDCAGAPSCRARTSERPTQNGSPGHVCGPTSPRLGRCRGGRPGQRTVSRSCAGPISWRPFSATGPPRSGGLNRAEYSGA